MDIHELLAKITDDSGRSIAKKAGINERTVLHQISKDRMPVENIVKIAATYGYSPVRALIDYGVMDESWANVPDIEGALRRATDEQLTDEILRRMKITPNPEWDEPVGDLAAKRAALSQSNEQGHPSPDDMDDGTVREWTDHPHAADTSPDEQAGREAESEPPID